MTNKSTFYNVDNLIKEAEKNHYTVILGARYCGKMKAFREMALRKARRQRHD